MTRESLVILGSSITALAIARNARALSIQPVIVDVEPGIATRSAGCDVRIVSERDESATLDLILSIGGPSAALIATSDYWVQFVADQESALRSHFKSVLHPAADVLRTCLSKTRFARWCRSAGLPATDFITADEIESARRHGLSFPIILRPAATLHHQATPAVPKAIEIHDETELDRWLSRFRQHDLEPFLSQSLLHRPLTQYSVGLARRGSEIVSITSRKLRPAAEQCRVGSCVATCSAPAIEALGRMVAEKLDFQGIAEVEILHAHDTESDFVIEVNPRPWLQYSLVPASGRDYLRFLLREDESAIEPADTAVHHWLNFRGDLYNCFSRTDGLVRNRRISMAQYLATIIRADAHANFSIRDLRPALSELKALAGMLVRR